MSAATRVASGGVPLSLEEDEEARAAPHRYVTMAGHEVEGAFVIEQDENFALAEKL